MSEALIIHGSCDEEEYFSDQYPSLSNSHWIPWLQKQLLMRNILTQTPEMPEPYKPDYGSWKKQFELNHVNEDSILIGHSCGGGFLVRWLSENGVAVKKLILVAPWMDPSRFRTTSFFDFKINSSIRERVGAIDILISDNESVEGVKESLSSIRKVFPESNLHTFHDMGHFTYDDMKTEKFPELLEIVLS